MGWETGGRANERQRTFGVCDLTLPARASDPRRRADQTRSWTRRKNKVDIYHALCPSLRFVSVCLGYGGNLGRIRGRFDFLVASRLVSMGVTEEAKRIRRRDT